ncbi:ABC transporter permease [Chitinophaga sp. Ak27]|uniref:ABC transporter permease n=1 Tax=Chitinophaga sp. Ak27 TaxID=2726116 RepID=UPI00145E370E|nr:ABC transporter permease [Chitinophaga sp. Ak27]NLU90539.1 ABC transporter permease [Chitinophaga sp. Ak27]
MKLKKFLKGVYALWYREFKVFLNEQSRIVSAIFLPIFWYFIFGSGVGSITSAGDTSYRHFIFPGFLVMTIIFSSLFNGAYIVWDKKIDFLKEVLIAPLSRTTIFIGKVIGGMTDALLQACILIIIGCFLGIPFTIVNVPISLAILFIFAIGLVSLGLIIGSFLESPESFGLVSSFVVYPLFLLSGSLYPLGKLPSWMKILTHTDPATYAVDALRNVILKSAAMPLHLDISVLLLFDVVLIAVGTWAFNRMKL